MANDLCRSVRICLELFAKSTFGLWKHQTNPACTKSVRVFVMVKLNIIRKKKRKPLCPARMDDGRRWRVLWGLDERKAIERMVNIRTVFNKKLKQE